MSLPFAKISTNWVHQNADVDDDVEILHHRSKVRYDQCICGRCIRFRYQKGIRDLERDLGRQATPEEIQDVYRQVQRAAGMI